MACTDAQWQKQPFTGIDLAFIGITVTLRTGVEHGIVICLYDDAYSFENEHPSALFTPACAQLVHRLCLYLPM